VKTAVEQKLKNEKNFKAREPEREKLSKPPSTVAMH
jgi:hypothetical protein